MESLAANLEIDIKQEVSTLSDIFPDAMIETDRVALVRNKPHG